VQKAGAKIETDLYMPDKRYYSFSLDFFYKEKDEEDRKRVRKLVGDHRIDRNGKLIEPGVPIPLKMAINKINTGGKILILDKEVSELRLWAWGGSRFTKLVEGLILEPGYYHVSIESTSDIPELTGTTVTFNVAFGHSK
jgi:hypothetical protein